MSEKYQHLRRRRAWGRPLAVAVFALALLAAAGVGIAVSGGSSGSAVRGVRFQGEEALSPIMQKKLASSETFSPGAPETEAGQGIDEATIDWTMHASPAGDVPLSAITGSRIDWKALKGRGADLDGNGHWSNLGPDNAVYPLNPFRNRSVYVPNEYVAAGRTAASVIDPNCNATKCRYWLANAGGGIWRTDNVLAANPEWEYVSGEFDYNNTAAIALDPNDKQSNTIYAGTGEPNICRSGCIAGVGLYKSKDGGNHWDGPLGAAEFSGRGIGSIAVKPGDSKTIFVASGAQGSRGMSSTCCNGMDRGATIPGAPHFGLWRSTDGGRNFTLVSQGNATNCTDKTPTQVFNGQSDCSPRGSARVVIDPVDPNTVYAAFFAKGIWRSNQNGDPGTWTQIFAPLAPPTDPTTGAGVERDEFDVVTMPNGDTRMYVGVGGGGSLSARFYRSDSVRTGTPTFTNLTNTQSTGFCDPQCNYDAFVLVPKKADGSAWDANTVYLIGSNDYTGAANGSSNGRAILLSTDAGATFTDETYDGSDPTQPHGTHPDQHSITTNPANWKQFLETSDGGVIRSNGNFVDRSGECTSVRHLTGSRLALCQIVLARVPELLQSINKGLNTLHFYEVAFNPNRPGELAGGAQDNGSWMREPGTKTWVETYVADGGYASFDPGNVNHSTLESQGGSIKALDEPRNQQATYWISDTLLTTGAAPFRYNREQAAFAAPTLFHPTVGGLLFTGREHVFRSLNGGVNPAFPRAKVIQHCNIWNGDGDIDENGTYVPSVDVCDDFKAMGDPGHLGRLTYGPAALCPPAATPTAAWTVSCPAPYPWGDDRSGGLISTIGLSASDKSTVWTATSFGRIFVTTNADAADASTIAWHRIDTTSSVDPPRYPTDIYVDPTDSNHAYITYSGYNANTPDTPGHVFEVTYDPATQSATFTNLEGKGGHALGDIPVGTIQRDERKGTLYIGTDFGPAQFKGNGWKPLKPGLPITTVPYLKIDQQNRILYVTTHGFGAWSYKLN
jgi:hypothetical protein